MNQAQMEYRTGDMAFIIVSNQHIRPVKILSCTGGIYTVRLFGGGAIRVKHDRLIPDISEASRRLPQAMTRTRPPRDPHMFERIRKR